MLFTELMHSIHPHLMKDADVPSFTRNIIQMLCDIPEKDWYTKKDPSSEQRYKDESLRKFYNRGLTYDNLIAVCHECFQKYTLSHTNADEKNLKAIKKLQADARSSRQTLDDIEINKGIDLVIENLSNAKPSELKKLTYDPVSVSRKIDENTSYFLVNDIKNNVTRYYQYIKNTMRNLSLKNVYSDDLIRAQMKESYKQLAAKKLSPEQIFYELSERIRRITKQDIRFCYIVVSYFVQSCEVFHDITK